MAKETALDAEIVACVRRTYGSTTEPAYTFVERRLRERLYQALRANLSHVVPVIEDDTDPNDDVSFVYQLFDPPDGVLLQLSMVGPYAALQRLAPNNVTAVVDPACPKAALEVVVLRELERAQIRALDEATLSTRIPFRRPNSRSRTSAVYQVLFTDVDPLPWSREVASHRRPNGKTSRGSKT